MGTGAQWGQALSGDRSGGRAAWLLAAGHRLHTAREGPRRLRRKRRLSDVLDVPVPAGCAEERVARHSENAGMGR